MTTPWKRALLAFASELGQAKIRFSLGGSGLLYFLGMPVTPHDIDIVIHEDDHDLLLPILSNYQIIQKKPNEMYKTKYFYHLNVLGIDVDIMVNFAIETEHGLYQLPFDVEYLIPHQQILLPLGSLADWTEAYHHMNRAHTLEIIKNYQSFRIQTKRLTIKRLTYENHADMYPYVSDPKTMYYERGPHDTYSLYEILGNVIPEQVMYGMYRTEDNQFLGHLYLGDYGPKDFMEYMIGYILHPDYHNQGYCTEATKALIGYAFTTLHAHRITAKCNPDNTASWRVMEKVGMNKEGHLKQRVCFKYDENGSPIWWDELIYGITADDWKELQQ
jgi:RimJ/RimL family protein N-acetyltransferase